MYDPLGLPSNDRLQIQQRVVAIANRFPGFVCRFLKLLFSFAGFLPILLRQLLKVRFRGLKLKVRHGVEFSIHKTTKQ
jgi:hypothetical protein